jgi:hypothetical protein
MRSWHRKRWLAFFLLVLGCAEDKTRFDLRYAPGFQRQGVSLSVFGVFKDGRLSSDASDDALGKLAPALGTIPCQAAFDGLADAKVELADATSDYAMAEGVTDELLDPFAPAAKGDFILTLAMAGKGALGADAGAEPPTSLDPDATIEVTTRAGPPIARFFERSAGGMGERLV